MSVVIVITGSAEQPVVHVEGAGHAKLGDWAISSEPTVIPVEVLTDKRLSKLTIDDRR